MKLLDTNVVLRSLLNDDKYLAEEARKIIEEGAEITIEILAECVFVLSSFYKYTRQDTADALLEALKRIHCERKTIGNLSLRFYASSNLSYPDCILVAEAVNNSRDIATFDRALKRYIGRSLFPYDY